MWTDFWAALTSLPRESKRPEGRVCLSDTREGAHQLPPFPGELVTGSSLCQRVFTLLPEGAP